MDALEGRLGISLVVDNVNRCVENWVYNILSIYLLAISDLSKFRFNFSFLIGSDESMFIYLFLYYIHDNQRLAWPCQDKISALEVPLLRREGGREG